MDGQAGLGPGALISGRCLTNEVRLRHVVQGSDGRLYILTDEMEGRILRLE